MSVPKLEIKNFTKRFGDVVAVNGIDLSVDTGESLVLLGPSGCGKTTTLRAIAGFHDPDEGEIFIDGTRVASSEGSLPPEKRDTGMVFQNYAVWPHKTVHANIAFGLRLKKQIPKAEIDKRVEGALSLVQMDGLGKRYPAALSGGQQQRVALARALVVEPTILLLDEPLSNLDAALREEMRFELRDLQARLGQTMVYVTHDQQEAMVLADRVVVMNLGKVEQVGTPEDIYRTPRSRFVANFIGHANMVEGEVMEVHGGTIKVKSSLGAFCTVSTPDGRNLPTGTKIGMVVRPEDIVVASSSSSEGADSFPGRLLRSAFLGQIYDLRVKVGEIEMRCMAPKGEPPSSEELSIQIRPEAWHILED